MSLARAALSPAACPGPRTAQSAPACTASSSARARRHALAPAPAFGADQVAASRLSSVAHASRTTSHLSTTSSGSGAAGLPLGRAAGVALAGRGARVACASSSGVAAGLLERELTEEETENWQSASGFLAAMLDLSTEDCDALLAKGFGWKGQGYWRRDKIEEVPTVEQVQDVLDFLRDELTMSMDEQVKVVQTFPEVLACDVMQRLVPNTEKLINQWKLEGLTLTKAVVRQPQVLGYTVDCGGDCIGECNRCWVRF